MLTDSTAEWESGVGGAQCDSCGRTTIVRAGAEDMLGVPTFWTCRPCAYGEDDSAECPNCQGPDLCLREVVVTCGTAADPAWLAATHVLCMRPLPCDNPHHKPDAGWASA